MLEIENSQTPVRRSGAPAASFSTPTASMVPFVILDGKKPGARAPAWNGRQSTGYQTSG
jgi:hypothetical protein